MNYSRRNLLEWVPAVRIGIIMPTRNWYSTGWMNAIVRIGMTIGDFFMMNKITCGANFNHRNMCIHFAARTLSPKKKKQKNRIVTRIHNQNRLIIMEAQVARQTWIRRSLFTILLSSLFRIRNINYKCKNYSIPMLDPNPKGRLIEVGSLIACGCIDHTEICRHRRFEHKFSTNTQEEKQRWRQILFVQSINLYRWQQNTVILGWQVSPGRQMHRINPRSNEASPDCHEQRY